MELVVENNGQVRCLYGEAIDLAPFSLNVPEGPRRNASGQEE